MNYENISGLISKLSADLNWVIPLSVTQRIIPYCKMGMSNQKLPVYEKFRLGGSISLPGYNRDELWGNHFIVLGILYRIEILKQMNVQFNFTLGSVYEKYQNFRWNNLSSGVSGGILALSPVGPIGLYYGRNENKRDILYLSIGYEF